MPMPLLIRCPCLLKNNTLISSLSLSDIFFCCNSRFQMGRQEIQSFQDLQSQQVEEANLQQNQSSDFAQEDSDSDSESSSSTITDLLEDASSPSPISSPSASNSSSMDGPLYELSELMTQLPTKRGLSKYYGGKSQSFTSLASVKSLEDLPKKENPYNMRMKMCKSYAGGLDGHPQQYMKRLCTPKQTISKRVSSTSSFLSTMCNRPSIPM